MLLRKKRGSSQEPLKEEAPGGQLNPGVREQGQESNEKVDKSAPQRLEQEYIPAKIDQPGEKIEVVKRIVTILIETGQGVQLAGIQVEPRENVSSKADELYFQTLRNRLNTILESMSDQEREQAYAGRLSHVFASLSVLFYAL